MIAPLTYRDWSLAYFVKMNLEVISNTARPRVSCAEKLELRTRYAEALKRQVGATNEVLLARGKVSKHEYEQTRTLADEARAALNVARQALEQHKQSHGC
jgi:hypothetical protein